MKCNGAVPHRTPNGAHILPKIRSDLIYGCLQRAVKSNANAKTPRKIYKTCDETDADKSELSDKYAGDKGLYIRSCSRQIIKIYLFNYFNNIRFTGDCKQTSNKQKTNLKRKRETVKKEKNDYDFSENFVIVYGHFRYKPVFGLTSTGDEIIENVFGYALTKCSQCVPALTPILENLVKRHQLFRYDICLNAYPQDNSLLPGQVSKAQLNEFFAKVLIGVLPKQLFGSKRNRLYIKDMIARFFKYGDAHYFSVHDTTRRLNVSNPQLLFK